MYNWTEGMKVEQRKDNWKTQLIIFNEWKSIQSSKRVNIPNISNIR